VIAIEKLSLDDIVMFSRLKECELSVKEGIGIEVLSLWEVQWLCSCSGSPFRLLACRPTPVLAPRCAIS
jgi:hypothetical protein